MVGLAPDACRGCGNHGDYTANNAMRFLAAVFS